MNSVLTLIANPSGPILDATTAEQVRQAIAPAVEATQEPDWLADGLACDVAFTGGDYGVIAQLARAAIGTKPFDVGVQAIAGRRKKLLIADMDSTIVIGETLDEIAAEAGLKEPIAAITERAMRGEIGFRAALLERVAMLEGVPETALDAVMARLALMPGAEMLIRAMKSTGAYTALVSGGFNFFTSRIRNAVGFDADFSNTLLIADGKLTGRVREPILGREAKLEILERLSAERGIDPSEAVAVGDGANDLGMIERAGLGVAYHAKPAVREAAGFRIDHGDLTALLYLQGYRRAEIEEPYSAATRSATG